LHFEFGILNFSDAALMNIRQLTDHVRKICLSFADVTEKLSHGPPTWFARGRKPFNKT
jgi:hypothetical protein